MRTVMDRAHQSIGSKLCFPAWDQSSILNHFTCGFNLSDRSKNRQTNGILRNIHVEPVTIVAHPATIGKSNQSSNFELNSGIWQKNLKFRIKPKIFPWLLQNRCFPSQHPALLWSPPSPGTSW